MCLNIMEMCVCVKHMGVFSHGTLSLFYLQKPLNNFTQKMKYDGSDQYM